MTLKLTTPEQARAAMLEALVPLEAEPVALAQGLGRTLAQDISAIRHQPPFPASAMDGYAVRAADCPGELVLVGESAAGAAYGKALKQGECVRIFTGAPLPEGADSVVIQEDVRLQGHRITMPSTQAQNHVRALGNDFVTGTILVTKGTRLDPIALALIASAGFDLITVARRPIVAILSGGDEIVSPGTTPGPFQVFDSITSGLTGLLEMWGAQVINFAPQRDTLDALQSAFEAALSQADLVVTVGGASVGDHDLMKPALAHFAPSFVVDRIAVRPGKPTWFATTQSGPVLGLPGNPASALVCAHLFLGPIIAKLQRRTLETHVHAAKLTMPLQANGPREHYVRAVSRIDEAGQFWVTPLEQQDSALLSVFHAANALIKCPPNAPALETGARVTCLSLGR